MKVLWLCNIVLPDFCEEFGIKKTNVGGWMTGMLCQMEQIRNADIGLCFPIFDESRLKNGNYGSHQYYSFRAKMRENDLNFDQTMVGEFKEILLDFQPDVIHIWGTEYVHAGAMVQACKELNLGDRVVIHIQGLVSIYASHFTTGVPERYLNLECDGYPTIENQQQIFVQRGKMEITTIQCAKFVIGRTEWDESCIKLIAPEVRYKVCGELLRPGFYHHKEKWSRLNCKKHSIFVSQATYPIKGFHFLIKALNYIVNIYPDVHVYVGGASIINESQRKISPYGKYLRELILENGLEKNITFLGLLNEEEMIQQYLTANVFVSPSTIENSSNSISEAMFLGAPVIASYVGGTPSLIRHNVDGVLYQCDAVYMLAASICKIFEDKEFADTISYAAIQTASERHDRHNIAENLWAIYKEVSNE